MNWFKPFYTFSNGSFVAYQGYLDYLFDAKDTSTDGTAMFNGLYWHSDRYAVGYGLKYFNDIYGIQNGSYGLKTTGFGHYFSVTYKLESTRHTDTKNRSICSGFFMALPR